MPTEQINITLGTAGHIDHGKTVLIKCLTGCDTDHLKAEKERGMSIELGFAPCLVADLEVGIVDVPGHENFIKTMVAGAASMDGVIFVVAADDSVMPQTREHLEILTLLGIGHGIVALTKIDRVPPEQQKRAAEETRTLLKNTFLRDAPILPVSNVTGEGFDGFIAALKELVASITPKQTDGLFRLPVERTFTLKGYGTVITGIPVSGAAAIGDELVLLPQNLRGRIRAIQVYKRQSDQVIAGQCAALNIPQIDHKLVTRGNTLTQTGFFTAQSWYLAQMQLLAHDKLFLKNGQKVKFHTGTSEVVATVYLMQGEQLQPGQEELVQIRLAEPLVAAPADRFIIRTLSPMLTIGGGMIIDALPRRLKRHQPHILQDALEQAQAVQNETDFVEYCLKKTEFYVTRPEDLALPARMPTRLVKDILHQLTQRNKAVLLASDLYIHAEVLSLLEKRLLRIVTEYHQSAPESPGIEADSLQSACRLPKNVLELMLARLKDDNRLTEKNNRWARPDFRPTIQYEDAPKLDQVENLVRKRLFHPPGPEDISDSVQLPLAEVERLLRILVEHEKIIAVDKNLFFHTEAVEKSRRRLIDHIQTEGPMESVKFKYLLDTTRKYAIPLLDYFDRIGLTRRVGYTRHLVQENTD
ncbi:MAG: hypothetical protein AMJ79_08550 [Phycisphaerae bacterium SM23_30]|nr:MAG: hypothetical protein AMJ79_08550 [Phycisphaerae bacterium SM23_30]